MNAIIDHYDQRIETTALNAAIITKSIFIFFSNLYYGQEFRF